MSYCVREATLDDADVLVRHRIGMFTDMGLTLDVPALDTAFRVWLADTMPAGVYRAWVVEVEDGAIAGGGGISILPWPPVDVLPLGQAQASVKRAHRYDSLPGRSLAV
jgi:hypothetical protein